MAGLTADDWTLQWTVQDHLDGLGEGKQVKQHKLHFLKDKSLYSRDGVESTISIEFDFRVKFKK